MSRGLLGALCCVLFFAIPSVHAQSSSNGRIAAINDSGTREMVALLERIARTTDPVVDVYMNRARAAGISTLLGRPMSPMKDLQLRVKIAEEMLRAGQTRSAIAMYEHVWEQIERRELPIKEEVRHMLRDMLGIAHLRSGGAPGGDDGIEIVPHRWIFPMKDAGSTGTEVARKAVEYYAENLRQNPGDGAARWLLNIAYMTLGEYPQGVPEGQLVQPTMLASSHPMAPFREVANTAGVALMGHAGGSVMEDLDGDGLLDLVASSRGLLDQRRFYRNEGDGSFSDWTQRAGLMGLVGGLNMTHADYDNDGDRDLLVLRGAWRGEAGLHPNSLLQNDGRGHFVDVTRSAGLFALHPTHSAAFGDYDGDGLLDVYVGNESSPTPKPSHPNQLFRNRGDGTFTDVAAVEGVDYVGFAKGVTWGDYDNDGELDLYISHLNGDNVLFHNRSQGSGGPRFEDVAPSAGVTGPHISFPTWFWDYDNDGWLDLLVAGFDMANLSDLAAVHTGEPFAAEHVHLYRNRGDGTFEDVSKAQNLDRIILSMGANFGDVDNDGFLDAYFGTGMPDLRALLPNRMMRNDGGQGFQDVTVGVGVGSLHKGHGVSFGDIDNDGDQDIYHVLGAAFEGDVAANVLFENPGGQNGWLTLFLQGVRANRDALGARVRVRVEHADGVERDLYATVGTGGSFGSSSLRLEMGLGAAVAVRFVEVRWPSKRASQRFVGLQPNGAYRLIEGDTAVQTVVLHRYDLSP